MSDRDTLAEQIDATKHLWDFDHPYYCNEGNFFVPGTEFHKVHTEFESWADFKGAGFYDGDRDMNLLFRWDWHAWHLDYPEDYPDGQERHVPALFFVLQRKAYNISIDVNVTPADEPEVRAWLAECAATIRAMWEPIVIAEVTP